MGVGECFWGEFYRINVRVGAGVGEVAGDGAGAGAEVDDERVGGVAKMGGNPVGELFGFGSGDEYSGPDGEGEGAEGGGAKDVLEGFSVVAVSLKNGVVVVEGGGEVGG